MLLLQRSRDFQDIILGSKLLQEQLYLEALRHGYHHEAIDDSTLQPHTSRMNPLLMRRFWPWYNVDPDYFHSDWLVVFGSMTRLMPYTGI